MNTHPTDSIVTLIDYSACGPAHSDYPAALQDRNGSFCKLTRALSEVNIPRFQALARSAVLNQTSYDDMVQLIREFLADRFGFRVLIALPDGRVIFDSFRADDLFASPAPIPAITDNSFANARAGTIAENHNTRVAIISAQLNESGIGYEQKYSTTTLVRDAYIARRLGEQFDNFGTFRLSTAV